MSALVSVSPALTAISPLDGRYARQTSELKPTFSEYGLIRFRLIVMMRWFLELTRLEMKELPYLSAEATIFCGELVANFSEEDAAAIKEIEKTTNHDVKAVEYWIKEKFEACKELKELKEATSFIHFACTSEDVNNLAHAMQMSAGREHLLAFIDRIVGKLKAMAIEWAHVPMLARTHGQTASPTTAGKEIANFTARLFRLRDELERVRIYGKLNGAVGNYNAHVIGEPSIDWEYVTKMLIERDLPSGFGLTQQLHTTQIEPHDYVAQMFDVMARLNTVLIGFSRDVWSYISLGYIKQKPKEGEIGSSTMPHKVNPIDFENAEGNLGLANAILRHMAEKLPISRMQRDLTDSTVLRNIGVGFGYSVVAYSSLLRGLDKIELNETKLASDLDEAWEVLAEPIQTMMRRYGVQDAYEKLKEATRGQTVTKEDLHKLINSLLIPEEAKARLLELTPATYVGNAAQLARRV